MKRAINIRLFPSSEQEILMRKHIGSMRYIFNWGLDKQIKHYKETKKTSKTMFKKI